jgi:hypothetical protein
MREGSIYTPEWVNENREEAEKMAREGSTLRTIASALKVRFRSLKASECPEVQDFIADLEELSRAHWEHVYGLAAKAQTPCEPGVFNKLMASRYMDQYMDRSETALKVIDGQKLSVMSTEDWDKTFT